MNYSRREFLGVLAAGISVAAMPVFLLRDRAAYGQELEEGIAYDQATADLIHNLSVEQKIREASEVPEAVKARVDLRLQSLRSLGG
jgi:hypothetical protein